MDENGNENSSIRFHLGKVLAFLIETVSSGLLPRADAIFVFGHNDSRVARHAIKLWEIDKADRIIFTGGSGPRTKLPVGFATEAEYYAGIARIRGVPDGVVISESVSTNTLENVLLGICAGKISNLTLQSLILVAMPPLLRRSYATFRKQFPEIKVVCSAPPDFSLDEFLVPSRLVRVLGEFERFPIYATQGDIEPVEIPPDVFASVNILRSFLNHSLT